MFISAIVIFAEGSDIIESVHNHQTNDLIIQIQRRLGLVGDIPRQCNIYYLSFPGFRTINILNCLKIKFLNIPIVSTQNSNFTAWPYVRSNDLFSEDYTQLGKLDKRESFHLAMFQK